MATKNKSTSDPKQALSARIEKASTVFAKHKDKVINDPKRRLALKKLKRAQRRLGKVVAAENKGKKSDS